MSTPSSSRPEAPSSGAPPTSHDEMDELRRLLLTPEQTRLEEAHKRLDRLAAPEVQLEIVSRVLPEAIARRTDQDHDLAQTLAPTIEETLRVSIRKDPKPMADALFPVIGPAIRKSIVEALRSFLEAVNRTLEHSLSPQSIRWRFEAMRTGRSFSEVVLSHTLLYRVEQLFLIDRQTGLPLLHLSDEADRTQDGALVSGMLSAIQAFVKDSFGDGSDEGLGTIEMGELTVWIEEGPKALLAAVIRGAPAPALRQTLQHLIATIHRRLGPALDAFDGDAAPFEAARPLLEPGFVSQFQKPERKASPLPWIVFGGLALALGLWAFFSIRERLRWSDFIARLEAEPGIVVIRHGHADGQWFVEGLRDPLATQPADLLAETPLRGEPLREAWEPYQALAPEILTRRAARFLDAPPTVTLRVEDGVLYAGGTATPEWAARARQRAAFLPAITAYDDAALDRGEAALEARIAGLEGRLLRFEAGTTRLATGQEALLNTLADEIRALLADAEALGHTPRLQILGHASSDGAPTFNRRLSRQRAEAVRSALIARGLPPDALEAVGTGRPRFPEATTPEQIAQNRSVSYRILLAPPSDG